MDAWEREVTILGLPVWDASYAAANWTNFPN